MDYLLNPLSEAVQAQTGQTQLPWRRQCLAKDAFVSWLLSILLRILKAGNRAAILAGLQCGYFRDQPGGGFSASLKNFPQAPIGPGVKAVVCWIQLILAVRADFQ